MNDPRHIAERAVELQEVLDWMEAVEERYRNEGPDEAIALLREFRKSLGAGGRRSAGRVPDAAEWRASWLRRVARLLSRELPLQTAVAEPSSEPRQRS